MGEEKVKILVTGAKGFLGKNLVAELQNQGYKEILMYDHDSTLENLESYARNCDFVFHLAGVNRPEKESEFIEGNFEFPSLLLNILRKYNNKAPILFASSIQALEDNPYGKSKKAGEALLIGYQKETGTEVFIYRLQNIFGKWCKPNYNSVVATFCHNIARDIPIRIDDSNKELSLVYVDDVVRSFVSTMKKEEKPSKDGIYSVADVYKVSLGSLAEMLYYFKECRETLQVADMSDDFTRKLNSTYLSYLPKDQFSYPLKMNIDQRGSFTEFLKTSDRGQISINISKPGIVKANHWHHTKNEKFLVVSGEAIIRFRNVNEDEIIECKVSSNRLEVVDIPPGYTHTITNIGVGDLVTVMWASEPYNPERPDTIHLEV